jgi:hypothetical protein
MAKHTRVHRTDYRLLIAPHINDRTYRRTTLVVLETVQAFASFRYELSVEESLAGKSLTYRILGLRAPSLTLPAAGRATYSREYEDLRGTYTVSVIGLDGEPAQCTVKIAPGKVDIVRPPSARTLTVITNKAQWKD